MRSLLLATLLLGCGTPKREPTQVPVMAPAPVIAPAVITPDAAMIEQAPAPDPADPNGPAAAVPIPTETPPPTLDLVDTTVSEADVAAITGWPTSKKSASGGEIWVVLHTIRLDQLELAVVRDDAGIQASYPLGTATPIRTELTYDGDAYPARDHVGDYRGRILFAVRITAPGAKTADQLVVFADDATLRVARRRLGTKAWKPVTSIAFMPGATFRGIGTTDPH